MGTILIYIVSPDPVKIDTYVLKYGDYLLVPFLALSHKRSVERTQEPEEQ